MVRRGSVAAVVGRVLLMTTIITTTSITSTIGITGAMSCLPRDLATLLLPEDLVMSLSIVLRSYSVSEEGGHLVVEAFPQDRAW